MRLILGPFAFVLALVLVLMGLCGAGLAIAEAAQSQSNLTNGSITDTQNLLGSQSAKIDDEINSTRQQTGVSVRLLFLGEFSGAKKPEDWVASVLESTKPKPNTVMLAVASNDGRLVVAVSKNSDSWLRRQKNVDILSQAALDPLQRSQTPDWPGSAISFMEKIRAIKHQRDVTRRTVIIVVSVCAVVVVAVASYVLLTRYMRKHSSARHGRKHK